MATLPQSQLTPDEDAPASPPEATAGTQQAAQVDEVLEAEAPLAMAHVTRLVTGVAAANPRSLGHELAARVVAASMQQMEDTIAVQKADIRSLSKANDRLKDEVGALKTANEVLSERLGTRSKIESLRGLFGVGGAALLGVAIDLHKAQLPLAVIVAVVGAVLVGFSIFGVPERKAK